jgi:hypothetical protein
MVMLMLIPILVLALCIGFSTGLLLGKLMSKGWSVRA